MLRPLFFSICIVGTFAYLNVQAGDANSTVSVEYELLETSTFTEGCFGPCLCPIFLVQGLKGTFKLTEMDPHPLFREFEVSEIDWVIPFEPPEQVIGFGNYRVGGEFASMHQLELDLVLGDGEVQHFDSGLMVGGSEFPEINISISVNDMVCFDTVFGVRARPVQLSEPEFI